LDTAATAAKVKAANIPVDHEKQSQQLHGRVAVVSGGAQGIGKAIAQQFQREGARVVLLDCDQTAGQAAADNLTDGRPPVPVTFVKADLQLPQEIRAAADSVRQSHGRLDILVNNAGIEIDRSFAETTVADWDRVIAVNLRGAFFLTQAMLPMFPPEGGAVVNISSIHATHAFPDSVAYACSKAGLIALTRNLALDLAPRHIRVNAICPGYIDTRLWEEYLRSCADPATVARQTTALHPTGRRGTPEDVAEAALFLASPGSSFVTGTHLVVDGGLTVRAHSPV
jgi:NAD(P)-dependent dehydrogenase (short-subunit alcohol dehydrogenase family)